MCSESADSASQGGDVKTEPGPGAGLEVRTGEVSGIRSAPAGWSVPAEQAPPGPIGSALHKLYGDVQQDASVVNRFVSDYLQLMHERVTAIHRLLTIRDYDALVVSILSLETTSAMIGAGDLVTVARTFRKAVEERQLDLASDLMDVLSTTVGAVRDRLADEGFTRAHPVE